MRATVAGFGQELKQVSLLSPDASSTMASAYGPYVDPALLAQWQANPERAPGRAVSSPWPESIVISSIAPQGAGYAVQGAIVYMTSADFANGTHGTIVPVTLLVIPEAGGWRIAAFQEMSTSTRR